MQRYFSKEDIQRAIRYTKRCWTPLAMKEMQIKTTRRWHLLPVRMIIIQKARDNKGWWGEKGTLVLCWWDCKLVQPLWFFAEAPQKIKSNTTIWSTNFTSGNISKKKKKETLEKISVPTVITAALFITARIWKQPRCPPTDEWIKKMCVCGGVCV